MLKLECGVSWVTVEKPYELEEYQWLYKTLLVPLPRGDKALQYMNIWQPTEWPFFDHLTGTFATGLLSHVVAQAAKDGIDVKVSWLPGSYILPVVTPPEEITWPGGRIIRPYQMALVKEALAKGRGIIKAATSSGKTGMMAMLLKCLGTPPALILVGSRSLVRQTRDEVATWLGEEVGEITASRRVISPPVVVALVQSLAARAHEPWAKEFLKERKVVMADECLHPDTLIATPQGDRPLEGIKVGDEVVTPVGRTAKVVRKWETKKPAVKYTTASGKELIASENHLVWGVRVGMQRAEVLPIKEAVTLLIPKITKTAPSYVTSLDYLYGLYLGDGTLHGSTQSPHLRFMYSATHGPEMYDSVFCHWPQARYAINGRGDHYFDFNPKFTRPFMATYGGSLGKKPKDLSIRGSAYYNPSRMLAVMQGLFDSDGYASTCAIGLEMTSRNIIEQVGGTLQRLGLTPSYLVRLRRHVNHNPIYRVLMQGAARLKFHSLIGFRVPHKLRRIGLGFRVQQHSFIEDPIVNKVQVGMQRLIDIELDDEQRLFIANGLVSHNCHHANRESVRDKKTGKLKGGQWYGLLMGCAAADRFGLSATPLKLGDPVQNWRLIGATGPVFENGITSSQLIDEGYAARPYIMFLPFQTRKLPARTKWQDVISWGLVNCIERNEAIAAAAKDLYDEGLKVLVLVDRKEHGKLLLDLLRSFKAPSDFIHGGLDQYKQEEMLEWLAEKGPRVMVSTKVLNEGTNIPDIGAVILARGGKAFVSLFQGIGRGVRPKGAKDQAGACIVIIPEDYHHKHLEKHIKILKVYLSTEEGYRIAVPGQNVKEFTRSVLSGAAKLEEEKEEDKS